MKHDSIGANWPGRDGCAIDRRRNEASVSNEPLFIFHFSLSPAKERKKKKHRNKIGFELVDDLRHFFPVVFQHY